MSWQLLIVLSVLLFPLNGLFQKVLMKHDQSDPYAQTIAFYGLVGIFAYIIALFRGGFHYSISLNQLPFFALLVIFATAAPVLVFKAIKLIDSSEASILVSSQRLWIVIGAFIFLHESFSLQKILGTIIILLGIAIAQRRNKKFVINEGVVFALLAAFSFGAAEIISYYILRDFDATSFTVYVTLLPVAVLMIFKSKSIPKLRFYLDPKHSITMVLLSINDTVATLLLYFGYQIGRNASQIAPIMATQTIISVILAIVILKERDNMINKIIGAIIVVGGVMLVV